jgi:hypothetical protein
MNLREIDRLVAEKVMGWEVPYEYDDIGIMAYTIKTGAFAFSPTTNIADAWQVVEKFDKTDFRVVRNYRGNYSAGLMYWNKDTMVKVEAKAETAPLAICLAALKSVGVEVDN